jgi:hypothetical protein
MIGQISSVLMLSTQGLLILGVFVQNSSELYLGLPLALCSQRIASPFGLSREKMVQKYRRKA